MKYRLLAIALLLPSLAQAVVAPLLGYGSSDAVIPAKDQELFFTGFEAGFEETFKGKIPPGLLALEHVYNGSQLGALDGARTLLNKGVKALVGFPTSHEALLVGKLAQENKVFGLFTGASHSNLAELGPYVYTTGESMEAGVVKALEFIVKRFPGKRGTVVFTPYAVYSTDQKAIFERLLKKPEFRSLSIEFAPLEQNLTLSPEGLKKAAGSGYLYLTQYASEATALMAQLQNQKLDIPMVTNSSWLTGDIEFVRRYLAPRKAPVYSAGIWLKGSPTSKPFENVIQKRYGISPTPEIAYGFDLGVIMATIYGDVKDNKEITAEMLRKAFVKRRCFNKTSSGTLCFGPSGGHALRPVQFLQFSKYGFVGLDKP